MSNHTPAQQELGPSTLANYLSNRGLEFRRRGDELQVKVCPFCHPDPSKPDNQYKLCINSINAVFMCHRCSTKGGAKDLVLRLGGEIGVGPVPYQNPGWNSAPPDKSALVRQIWSQTYPLSDERSGPAKEYLRNRGLRIDGAIGEIRFHPELQHHESKTKHAALVFRVRDSVGNGCGLQRIYIDSSGNKAAVSPNKMALGNVGGGAIRFDAPSTSLHVAEGPETALAVRQALSGPTWSTISASGMRSLIVPPGVRTVSIWADLDRSKTGEEAAEHLASRLTKEGRTVHVCVPSGPLLGDKKGTDWLDLLNSEGETFLQQVHTEAVKGSLFTGLALGEAWTTPNELMVAPKAPTLPPEMLPECLKNWLTDISARMQVPLEMPAVTAIVALGSAIGRRCKVLPKAKDDWAVYPNLWGALVAPPSTLKSPVIKEVLAPLQKIASETQESNRRAVAEAGSAVTVVEAKIKAATKGLEMGVSKCQPQEIARFEGELAKLNREKEAIRPRAIRYLVNDTTIEKLAELLKDNPEGLLLVRDELHGFLRSLERQGHESDRTFYLESWNGYGEFVVDRIGRGTLIVPSLCLSIFGGIQPSVLQRYFSEVITDDSSGDGFFSRFQVTVAPEMPDKWTRVDREPDELARKNILNTFRSLIARGNSEQPLALRFSMEAQSLFDQWQEELENRLRSEEITAAEAFGALLAKYRKLVPALALIFECVAAAAEDRQPEEVGAHSFRLAAAWADFLEGHARKLYTGTVHPELPAARELLRRIRHGDIQDRSLTRDVYRKGWSLLGTKQKLEAALAVLEENGWIKTEENSGTIGRPCEMIRLHPSLRRGPTA